MITSFMLNILASGAAAQEAERPVVDPLIMVLTVFVLSVFLGLEVISKVPTMLHTPLMSGTNAIHGIVLVGAMIVAGAYDTTLATILGFIAVVFAAGNVVGGFVVTDRMLQMFKKRPQPGGKK